MRKFQYVEPGYKDEPITVTVSEEWIIRMYLPWWWKQMIKAGRTPDRFALQDAIDDFCIVNWAVEL